MDGYGMNPARFPMCSIPQMVLTTVNENIHHVPVKEPGTKQIAGLDLWKSSEVGVVFPGFAFGHIIWNQEIITRIVATPVTSEHDSEVS